jgi:hypothetical protein
MSPPLKNYNTVKSYNTGVGGINTAGSPIELEKVGHSSRDGSSVVSRYGGGIGILRAVCFHPSLAGQAGKRSRWIVSS